MGYSDRTKRSIRSVKELKPGDHIRVPVSNPSSHSYFTSAIPYERCDDKLFTHHLVVVEAIDNEVVMVIHKVTDEIVEEKKRYRVRDVTVLDYESQYMGAKAVQRAREIMGKGEEYKLVTNNSEHFVTEVRTGERQSSQVQRGVVGGVGGGVEGAVVGGAAGAGGGALIGAGIGSIVPVAGTIVGGVIGGIIGGVAGVGVGGAGGAARGAKLGIKGANKKD